MYKDTRLGGIEKWYDIPPKDAKMRIPDDLLESVCFLAVKGKNGYQIFGTGFFVGLTKDNFHFVYLFTAQHLITYAENLGFSTFYARLNKKEGGFEYVELRSGWAVFENVDLAFMPFGLDFKTFKHKTIPYEFSVSNDLINHHGIGVGDDLISIGLFTKRKGNGQNLPIVRSGIIASMPDELLIDEDGYKFAAYLAELRSLGGLSGSPVFVYIHNQRPIKAEDFNAHHTFFLLGIIRGHWEAKYYSDVEPFQDTQEFEPLNTGVAIITPAHYISEALNCEEFVKMRDESIKNKRKEDSFTEDSAVISGFDIFTEKKFGDALKKVSRKISEPVSEKKETSE